MVTDIEKLSDHINARMEIRCGYNKRVKKYYVEILDVDTEDNMRIYLDANEFEDFGKHLDWIYKMVERK